MFKTILMQKYKIIILHIIKKLIIKIKSEIL